MLLTNLLFTPRNPRQQQLEKSLDKNCIGRWEVKNHPNSITATALQSFAEGVVSIYTASRWCMGHCRNKGKVPAMKRLQVKGQMNAVGRLQRTPSLYALHVKASHSCNLCTLCVCKDYLWLVALAIPKGGGTASCACMRVPAVYCDVAA